MNRLISSFLTACLLGAAAGALAQPLVVPLEFNQSQILYNFQATRGVPISTVSNTPPGSDGRMPTTNESGSALLPTTNQFRSFIAFGGVPGLTISAWQAASNSPLLTGSTAFSGAVAQAMGLPVGSSNNAVVVILRRAQVGAPYLNRSVSFPFGSIVAAPQTDENGILLTNQSAAYWQPKPYAFTSTGSTNSGYYWSPHAGKVYASQAGPISITWMRTDYVTSQPTNYITGGVTNYFQNGGNYFRLHTVNYIVSGTAVKPTKKLYWTENIFRSLGKPVGVPTARVGAVVFAYNQSFPATVTEQNRYVAPGETPPNGTTNQVLNELRTLWYDQGAILAYNREGRVFTELLGDLRPDGVTREPLGFEIVDVVQNPTPLDKVTELGEVIPPPIPDPLETLTPEPVLQSGGQIFAYQQNVGSSGVLTLYATRETVNQNDYLVHWMEEGVAGLKWPKLLGRYQLVWPDDVAKYSHYVRPLVATEEEAKATSVPLPTANAPTLEYQDPLDKPRGKLTDTFRYYTWLDAAHPAHRALLRFSAGEEVSFERVFSWLDVNLKSNSYGGTVATNLTVVADYLAAPSRGVNGDWKLNVKDVFAGADGGSIASWAVVVETVAPGSGTLSTTEFTSSGPITIPSTGSGTVNATPYPSTITVRGVNDAVTAVRVKLSGLSHTFPDDIDARIVGPRGEERVVMAHVGGGGPGVNNVNVVFDDAASGPIPNVNFPSGTYRPTANTLAGLLLPAPTAPTPWQNEFTAPRVVSQAVNVGQRINAPTGEPGASGYYLAGHLNLDAGTLFDVNAYIDPFVAGFNVASLGAIIPVNAIPNANALEVWWFRTNAPSAGANAANFARGFQPIFWPSAIGRYTLQWPTDPTDEIVLASNDGSRALQSLQALGSIYYQNDRTLPGFNPNEEHALMQGGQAYALRDDLNITTPGSNYSSAAFVLLEYQESDSRPAMRTFKVLREKGADRFNYQVEAGAILQPPMPLPLMDLPLGPKPAGAEARSLNQETYFRTVASSTASGELTTVEAHHFQPWYRELALQSPDLSTNKWFFATNADYSSQTLQGVVSDTNSFELSNGSSTSSNTPSIFRYDVAGPIPGVGKTVYVMAPESGASWQMTMLSNASTTIYLNLTGGDANAVQGSRLFVPVTNGLSTDQFAGWHLRTEPIPASHNTNHGSFTLQDRKGNIWVYRGPHEPGDDPWMDMQYYYKTLPGFFFPTLPLAQQPPPGTITPYLRNTNSAGTFEGDPVYGNPANSSVAGNNNALAIHYRPVWPAFAPVLQMAETLTMPKRGLPAVRGQTSLEVIYQQSQVTDSNRVTVRLHDPTREKEFELAAPDSTSALGRIPDSVKTETSLGRTYFPLLPPHLGQRFFLDPNRGQHGKLVFRGEFVDEIVGDKYLNLNVLSAKDAATLSDLCLSSDPARARWNNAIAGVTTRMEKFVESPQQPGTYVPAEGAVTIGPGDLAEVTDDDVAVDSYALTAVGPGSGYVTLIAGNGLAFTPRAEPVSVLVMRVADVLYPGELKILASPNPLAEQLTMQQVVDLAGQTKDYEFEWKIAAPVDGLPPQVYENTHVSLLGEGIDAWGHVIFPLSSDSASSASTIPGARIGEAGGGVVSAVGKVLFSAFTTNDGKFEFTVDAAHHLALGNQVTLRGEVTNNSTLVVDNFTGIVSPGTTLTKIVVNFSRDDIRPLDGFLGEAVVPGQPQSIVFRKFTVPANTSYSQLWLSLDLADFLGANVYLNGERVVVANQGTNDTTIDAPPSFTPAALGKAYRLDPAVLARNSSTATQQVVVELFSQALPGTLQQFNLHLDAYEAVDKTDQGWLPLAADKYPDGIRTVLGEKSDVQALSDNYLIMRYHATNSGYSSGSTNWSRWTTPQLAEGWIKRVLAGINPFNQRTKDLFNNVANTDASILTQAGHRWEGDVALNLESINSYGLIEIYETVLRRGRLLSIDGGINYGPANDALLLAAGYLNDLYMMVGNEAWADAANPTIGIGTANQTYGDIATSLFAFKGQEPSLLEEELALLRGRDDFLQPGVAFPPFYNRLVWNYTRGIDAGEVIYALNYNIQENPNHTPDGNIDAADAARMFPMGHGDAYGHYLTALKGYYSLLLNNNFDWVPRIEAVTVLGVPVSVDYQDERKFAAAAAALGRAGRQTFDLTWRKDYQPGHESGWGQFSATRVNSAPPGRTRYWGLDHWATRTAQGDYLNWVVGNAILPAVDPNPNHEGIQKIDRTTVPELKELATMASDLQTALDNAEGGLTPLGLAQGSLALDINPNAVVGTDNGTHFEQIYNRAKATLNNAVAAFDDAKDVTRLMRSEQDSLAGVQAAVAKQELAYTNALIELYGTPYSDDIGVGKTYKQGYTGPDLFHYMYVDDVTLYEKRNGLWAPNDVAVFPIDIQDVPEYWANPINPTNMTILPADNPNYTLGEHYIEYQWGPNGFMDKPASWTGKRKSPGKIQQAISEVIAAHDNLYMTITALAMSDKGDLDKEIQKFESKVKAHNEIRETEQDLLIAAEVLRSVKAANEIFQAGLDNSKSIADQVQETILEAFPKSLVVGLASGGDLTAPARSLLRATKGITKASFDVLGFVRAAVTTALQTATETASEVTKFNDIAPKEWSQEMKEDVQAIGLALKKLQGDFIEINKALRRLDDANRAYLSILAEGDRILEERLVFRQRTAAVVQGYRTRDAAFRIFRNEKLERYKTLFDLAARYSLLAANAYDYETGLLNTQQGKEFLNRIVSARALGVVRNGEPQYAGSNLGDPGLSSALAEMKADWDVVKTRLGFNNPDAYGTTVSLRTENFRILPTTNSDVNWQNLLQQNRHRDLLEDRDVQRNCLQISRADGLPVPGIIIEFSTTIADGYNLFGQKLAAGDHAFSPSSFATKIFGVGAALEGYRGMDQPAANGNLGGITPPDPNLWYLDPLALAATPYVYLIPVGEDSMRSPPLGDASDIRSWSVDDVAIPLPFNIGASQLSNGAFYQTSDFLTEPLFAIRKHQAFRPVPSASFFSTSLYGGGGTLMRTQYTNNRLIGRSAWNSRWKLVIPGHTLLNDPDEGLERLIKTVRDVKLHFVTYSYSGN